MQLEEEFVQRRTILGFWSDVWQKCIYLETVLSALEKLVKVQKYLEFKGI